LEAGTFGLLGHLSLGIGILVLRYSEGLSFINAFYCACVTLTTLGYGDVSFQTVGGRLFAVFWILLGTVCVAQLFLYLAEFRTKERQHKLAHWALTRPTTFSDLEAADLDGDGIVK
jgi:potassium channel subfamily K